MASTTYLSVADAIAKLEAMLRWIEAEVEHAVRVEASLEAANKVVVEKLQGVGFDGFACPDTVQRVTALHLAITLAKLYETPSPDKGTKKSVRERTIRRWDRSDIASIPLIVRLMHHAPCQIESIQRARNWTPMWPERADQHEKDCRRAVASALAAYVALCRSSIGRHGLRTVQMFRNEALAHIRTDALLNRLPKYGELFGLVDTAKIIVGQAMIAVIGKNDVFDDVERHANEESVAFWQPAIRGAVEANRWDRDLSAPSMSKASSGKS